MPSRGGGGPPARGGFGHQSTKDRHMENDFAWVARQVEALGNSKLKGMSKKAWEAEQIKEQGGIAPKSQKVPLKILMGMKKKKLEREEKAETRAKERGVFVAKKKPKATSESAEDLLKQLRGNRRGDWRNVGDGQRGLSASIGTFKNGMLHINPRDIATVNRGGNPELRDDKPKRGRGRGGFKSRGGRGSSRGVFRGGPASLLPSARGGRGRGGTGARGAAREGGRGGFGGGSRGGFRGGFRGGSRGGFRGASKGGRGGGGVLGKRPSSNDAGGGWGGGPKKFKF